MLPKILRNYVDGYIESSKQEVNYYCLLLTLFKSIVLSRFDYGSQLWSTYNKDIYVNLREYNDHLQSIFLGCKIHYMIRD